MKPSNRNTPETTGFYACWFCLWVAPLVGFAQSEVTARKWQVHELVLEAQQSYQNPYAEVQLSATFEGSEGTVISTTGYWVGGNG